MTLSGTQRSNSSAQSFYIQNASNVQLGYVENNFAKLQFGEDAVTASVSASQSVTAQGGAVTINGSAAASSVATSSRGNRIVFTSAADDSARTFTVTGTDMFGRALTETITGANAAAASGSKYFATVTAVSAGAGGSSSVAVGWATESVTGNVTQQNDIDLTALTGKVGGSITLTRTNNSFRSVTGLTAVGAISLQTDDNYFRGHSLDYWRRDHYKLSYSDGRFYRVGDRGGQRLDDVVVRQHVDCRCGYVDNRYGLHKG